MKRIFIIVLVISLLVVPAAADSWFSSYSQDVFNALDYTTPNSSGSRTVRVNNGDSVLFDFDGIYSFGYVDILVQTQRSTISSVLLNDLSLNLINYGNGMYRFYGTFPKKNFDSFKLVFTTTGAVDVTFLSFDASPLHSAPAGLTGQFTWERFTNTSESGTREQSSFRDSVSIVKPAVAQPIYDAPFISWKLYVTADDWQKYDYLTFLVGTDLLVDSIYCYGDLGVLPFTTNEVVLGDPNSYSSFKAISVTVDISSYPKDSSSEPQLCIMASQDVTYPGSFYLYEVTGSFDFGYEESEVMFLRKLFQYSNNWWSALYTYLSDIGASINTNFTNLISNLDSNFSTLFSNLNDNFTSLKTNITNNFNNLVSKLTGWFDNLFNKLNYLIEGSPSGIESSDKFQDDIGDQSSELEDLSESLNSVNRPDISNVKLGVGDLIDGNSLSLATSGFSSLFGMDIFTRILMMALTFALIGFVLFGKR